ncbi:hypothetical protein [Methanobacterium sp. ACI-7]|uniref:hypothetical protein n=1 Tax=unclassified Methanobacterium TaxID=2627676 RepID=UPI0039C48306
MAEYIKQCRTCTTKFVAKRKDTKYCSDYCRKRAFHFKNIGIYLDDLLLEEKREYATMRKGEWIR